MRNIIERGFTLSEILITIGIIGVISAITIPNLITKYQKFQTILMLKKTYADIMRVHKMAVAEYGDSEYWQYPGGQDEQGAKAFIEKYYIPFLNGEAKYYSHSQLQNQLKHKIYNLNNKPRGVSPSPGIVFMDGGVLRFFPYGNYMWIFSDINGVQGPNKVGRDIFMLFQYDRSKSDYTPRMYGYHSPKTSLKVQGSSIKEAEAETNRTGFGCSESNKYGYYAGWYCGEIIRRANWSIPDDYPW